MTEVQNKILGYLVDNANTDNEIVINNGELAKACGVSIPTIQKFQKDAVKEGVLLFEKGRYIIGDNTNVDYTYLVSNTLKDKDITLTPNEKKVLGYITKRYNDRGNGEEYGFSDLQHIADNCKVTPITVSRIVKKLVKDSLIEIIKGDFKAKRATQFKVLFDNVEDMKLQNNNTNVEQNHGNINNIQNQYNGVGEEVLQQILNKLDKIEQENLKLHESLLHQAERYGKIEGVAEILLDYIDEVERDLDNMYVINNIQRPKPQCRCNIKDIRKYLDKE